MTRICPVCRGPKSARAQFCSSCRRAANAAGETLVLAGSSTAATVMRTPVQNRVYHGKLADLALRSRRSDSEVKHEALDQASRMFARRIESSTELTEPEMERLLEWLTDRLEEFPPLGER